MSGVTRKFWLSRDARSKWVRLKLTKPTNNGSGEWCSENWLEAFCLNEFRKVWGHFPAGTAMEVEITIKPTGEVME